VCGWHLCCGHRSGWWLTSCSCPSARRCCREVCRDTYVTYRWPPTRAAVQLLDGGAEAGLSLWNLTGGWAGCVFNGDSIQRPAPRRELRAESFRCHYALRGIVVRVSVQLMPSYPIWNKHHARPHPGRSYPSRPLTPFKGPSRSLGPERLDRLPPRSIPL
jgi:hypothetical protein